MIARTLPFVAFIAILALRMVLVPGNGNSPGTDLRWLYGLQVGIGAALLLACRASYVELRVGPMQPGHLALSLVTGIAVFAIWILPQPGWMVADGPAPLFVPVDPSGELRLDLILLRAAGAVLMVPVMEELFWRSFLMRRIDRADFLAQDPARVSALAVLVSSAVFASAHQFWFVAFLAGLAYAALYRRLGNLWYAIAAHATTNLALALWVVATRHWYYW